MSGSQERRRRRNTSEASSQSDKPLVILSAAKDLKEERRARAVETAMRSFATLRTTETKLTHLPAVRLLKQASEVSPQSDKLLVILSAAKDLVEERRARAVETAMRSFATLRTTETKLTHLPAVRPLKQASEVSPQSDKLLVILSAAKDLVEERHAGAVETAMRSFATLRTTKRKLTRLDAIRPLEQAREMRI